MDDNCPKCQSENTRCWDERTHTYEDITGEWFEIPVGYFVCRDCGKAWIIEDISIDENMIDITEDLYDD